MSQPSFVYAQSGEVVAQIEKAIGAGDTNSLLENSSGRIAVAVFGEAREYSTTQAAYVLKDFFKDHPPASFDFDQTSSTSRGKFLQGVLRHSGEGGPLEVYVRLRLRRDTWELREIIIRRGASRSPGNR